MTVLTLEVLAKKKCAHGHSKPATLMRYEFPKERRFVFSKKGNLTGTHENA